MPLNIVNMVPQAQSGETNQDSEPQLTVNPQNSAEIVGSAFTPDPGGGANAPVYVSEDSGNTWLLSPIIPGGNAGTGTGDVSVRFSDAGVFYAGVLRGDAFLRLNILRGGTFNPPAAMDVLVTRDNVDQPYVAAATSGGTDRVYVGVNDDNNALGNARQSTVWQSLDAATAAAPAGFARNQLETRATAAVGDAPSVRPAVHPDGTVYVAYLAWRAWDGVTSTTDVVICRDDNWGNGGYQDLLDAGDGLAGNRIATGLVINWISPRLGQERVGSDLAVAVDPTDRDTVYVAWADNAGGPYTLHVRRSTDGGANWSADLRTVTNAKNPGLAVDSGGRLGFLFQQVTGTGASQRWVTTLELTSDGWATPATVNTLATVPANTPVRVFSPYIGDYVCLLARGRHFYGVFCANNTPDAANFPSGVHYQRNANFTTHTLLALDNVTPVAVSIDPFFFHLSPRVKFRKELKPEVKELKRELKELIKEHLKAEVDVKQLTKELIKERLKEAFKEKDKDLWEGREKLLSEGDPLKIIGDLAQRVDELEEELANARSFIRPAERPDVGGRVVRGETEDA